MINDSTGYLSLFYSPIAHPHHMNMSIDAWLVEDVNHCLKVHGGSCMMELVEDVNALMIG